MCTRIARIEAKVEKDNQEILRLLRTILANQTAGKDGALPDFSTLPDLPVDSVEALRDLEITIAEKTEYDKLVRIFAYSKYTNC